MQACYARTGRLRCAALLHLDVGAALLAHGWYGLGPEPHATEASRLLLENVATLAAAEGW